MNDKIKVLALQELEMVAGGRGNMMTPDAWSTASNNCGSVRPSEWSTVSNGCGKDLVVAK